MTIANHPEIKAQEDSRHLNSLKVMQRGASYVNFFSF